MKTALMAGTMLRGPMVTFAPDGAEGGGGLTVDAAIQSLLQPAGEAGGAEKPAKDEKPAQQAQAAAGEGDDKGSEGDGQTSEDADAEGAENADGEGEQTEEVKDEAVAPAEPPKYWSKDAKDAFAKLPPELQAVVLAQEGPREEAASKAKADAAERIKVADAEVAQVQQLSQRLAEFLPQALETFASRWGVDPDWVAIAEQHGAEAMTLAKARYDAELQQLQKLSQARVDAEEQAQRVFVRAEAEKLADIEPELTDPAKGKERRGQVVEFLVKSGIEREQTKLISAAEMSIAYDAMRWREAQAKLKAAPKPLPKVAANPTSAARPGAGQQQTTPAAAAKSAEGRFFAKPTIDNAVALLLAKG